MPNYSTNNSVNSSLNNSDKNSSIVFINDNEGLKGLVANIYHSIKSGSYVGLDTEFERRTTFYPKPALLQIQLKGSLLKEENEQKQEDGKEQEKENHQEITYIVDPTQLVQFDTLFEALSQSKVLMHACREDLEVFRMLSDKHLEDFFDTQVAASLLGCHSQISYQNLVADILSHQLDKTETCSDWLKRPLSESQIHYAADDVIYLEKIRIILFERLEAQGRMDWYLQEMSFLKELVKEPSIDSYFFKMKGLNKLNAQQLQHAYNIIQWREDLARSKNIPRGFLIKDKALLEVFKLLGSSKDELTNNELRNIKEVPAPFIRRYADSLRKIIASPIVTDRSQTAIEKVLRKLPDSSKELKQLFKKCRDKAALELDIKPEILLSNRLLEATLDMIYFERKDAWTMSERDQKFIKILQAWRYDIFKEIIIKA